MIERDGAGRLTWDSRASLAIAALPLGDLPERLSLIEYHYHDWAGRQVTPEGQVIRVSRGPRHRWRRFVLWMARRPLELFRSEIEMLAQFAQKVLIDERARAAQQSFYADYVRIVDEQQQLRAYLLENYKPIVQGGEARNTPLLQVAREVIVSQRQQLDTQQAELDIRRSRTFGGGSNL